MIKVTFQFSLKFTIDHLPEFSLNVFNGCQSETDNTLVNVYVDLLVFTRIAGTS